jgi:SAM-dependent methyltransferase
VRRAFVDYYRERDISPVKQDTSDRERHFGRRGSLYRFLGIPPLYVEGARVLEFGPGSGDNALYTASLDPAEYVLVDGNPRGLRETREHLTALPFPADRFTLIESYVEDFSAGERFDLVLAEGLLPFQNDPGALARHMASFVRPGGVFVITTADAASGIGEVGRRLLANCIAPPSLAHDERRARLAPVFAPHLATIAGMSRSVEDWVDDNIVHPLTGPFYSIADAIGDLAPDGFSIYGSSPHFLTDWRWYKQVYGAACRFNDRAVTTYHQNIVNLLDYRITLDPHDAAFGERLLAVCNDLHGLMLANDAGDAAVLPAAIAGVRRLAALLEPVSAATALSVSALAELLAGDVAAAAEPNAFSAHFGRGQQYLSFVRER